MKPPHGSERGPTSGPERDYETVAAFFKQVAATPVVSSLAPPLASASLIWWKAQRLRQLDEARRSARWLDIGELVQLAMGAIGLFIVVALWVQAAASTWLIAAAEPREPSAPRAAGVIALPKPTGSFPVGRVTVHWTDVSRQELPELGGGARELTVDIWYPAGAVSASGAPAAYWDPSAFQQPTSAERLRGLLRGAYDAIRDGRVRTHATEGAPFHPSLQRAPVLIFSHGGGEAREAYSAQIEDLASHGYVVAALSHTHEAVLTITREGKHVTLARRRWPRPTVTTIEGLPPGEEASPDRLRWWADDMRFVVDRLTATNGDATHAPDAGAAGLAFAGRLDLTRLGAFGHSAGGQAAAHACQVEPRLRACLNQDGLSAFAPYYLDASGWGMDQRFMLIVRNTPREPPSAEDLKAMNMTADQAAKLIDRLEARQEAALRRTGGGAYRVLIDAASTTHADFGDLPFLQAVTAQDAEVRAQILASIRLVTRGFFDAALKDAKPPLLDGGDRPRFVEAVQRFAPAAR